MQLQPARSLDLLRLLQEALTNVFKHSRASRVEVRIERQGERLHVQVRDDGIGVPQAPDKSPAGGGAGLASMRLRATRLGGELRVHAAMPGTELLLDMPLAA